MEEVKEVIELEMRNLKTKDLPKMMRIVKKLQLKDFLKESINVMFNEDVDPEKLKDLKGKTKEEKAEILKDIKDETLFDMLTSLLDQLIENYDRVYDDLNDFIGDLYGLKKKDVEDLDLDVFIGYIYNLRNQTNLMVFFKTALK